MKKRNIARTVISIVIGLLCLAVWLHFIDVHELLNYMRQVNVGLALGALGVYLLAYVFRSLRWNVILSSVQRVPAVTTFIWFMAAMFVNFIIPVRAGEVAKSYFLKRKYGLRMSRTLPTVFIDKLFDSIAIVLVLGMLPFLPIHLSKPVLALIWVLVGLIAAGFGVMVFATVARERATKLLLKLVFFAPESFAARFEDISKLFVEGVGLFRHHLSLLPRILLLTALAVLADGLFILLLFQSFNVAVPFSTALFGYTLVNLSYILPHPPAQIGSHELLMLLIFSVGFGLDRTMVSAVMAFGHIVTGMLLVALGMSALSWSGVGMFGGRIATLNEEDA